VCLCARVTLCTCVHIRSTALISELRGDGYGIYRFEWEKTGVCVSNQLRSQVNKLNLVYLCVSLGRPEMIICQEHEVFVWNGDECCPIMMSILRMRAHKVCIVQSCICDTLYVACWPHLSDENKQYKNWGGEGRK